MDSAMDFEQDRDSLLEADDGSLNGAFGKSRKPNWTSHEIRALMEGYDRNRAVLRSRGVYKGTGERAVNNARRQGIWEEITMEVNKSRPDIVSLGAHAYTSNCMRTTKEVVKKWVNLVNRMKSDFSIRRSNPHYEIGATSRAVYAIVSKEEPLSLRDSPVEHLVVKEEPGESCDEDSMISADDSQVDYLPAEDSPTDTTSKRFTKIPRVYVVPSTVKEAILKRHLQQNGGDEDADADADTKPSSAKKQSVSVENGSDSNFNEHSGEQYTDFENIGGSEFATDDADEHLKATYKLNKDIMELQKRKLEVEIERMLVEKEKAELEKDQAVIEKEMALLKKEKLRMELEQLKQSMNSSKDKKSKDL